MVLPAPGLKLRPDPRYLPWQPTLEWLGSSRWGKETRRLYWKRFDAFARSRESTYRQTFLELFDNEERGVLRLVETTLEEGKADPGPITPESLDRFKEKLGAAYAGYHEDWRQRYNELTSQTFNIVLGQIQVQTGIGVNPLNPNIVRAINERVNLLVGDAVNGGVPDKTHRAIMDTILQGIRDGEGQRELAKRVQDVFGRGYYRLTADGTPIRVLSAAQRARLIARTETTATTNHAGVAGIVETGLDYDKTWVNQGDDRVRPDHSDAFGVGGEKVDAKDQFSNGLSYPMEPNCRCTLFFTLRKPKPGVVQTQPATGVPAAPERVGTPVVMPRVPLSSRSAAKFDAEGWMVGEQGSSGDEVNQLFRKHAPTLTPRDFAQRLAQFPTGEGFSLEVTLGVTSSTGDRLSASIRVLNEQGDTAATINRTLDFAGRTVDNARFYLARELQGRGLGKHVLTSQIDLYREMGVESVTLTTADIGGYAWARYGFVPETEKEWQRLKNSLYGTLRFTPGDEAQALKDVLDKLTDPKDIRLIASNPLGKKLLIGQYWSGRLDLNDTQTMDIFDRYARRTD